MAYSVASHQPKASVGSERRYHDDEPDGHPSPVLLSQSSSTRMRGSRRLPKKERLRLGRATDKERLAALRSRLGDSEPSEPTSSDSTGSSDKATRELDDLRTKLALSVQKTAAIEAASNAALAAALRVGNSLQHAQQIAGSTASALHNLAAADAYVLVQFGQQSCGLDGCWKSPGPAPGLGMHTAHPERPGTEAVASAANGLGSSTCGGTMDSDRPDEYDIFDADDEFWHSPLPACRAAADVAASGCSANADAAAGMVTSPTPPTLATGVGSSLKTLVEVHELCAFPGGEAVASPAPGNMSVREACTPGSSNPGAQNGAADSTLYNAGQKVTSDVEGIHDTGNTVCTERQCGHGAIATFEPDAQPVLSDAIGDHVTEEPDEYLKDSNSRHLGMCVFSSGTPGSSNPGAQNGAEEFFLYNAAPKVSSYSEGIHEAGKTALPEQQCGQVATANLGHEPVHGEHSITDATVLAFPGSEAMASGATGVDNAQDFGSPSLASTCGAEPALPELLSGRDVSLKHFNSQNLANTCVDTSSKPASPVTVEHETFIQRCMRLVPHSRSLPQTPLWQRLPEDDREGWCKQILIIEGHDLE